MTNKTDWVAATTAVDQANAILIVTHVSPDGDAMGSLLGLGNALRERGRNVTCAVDGGVPGYLGFVPGAKAVLDKLTFGHWDVMISVDASDEERTGAVGKFGRDHSQRVINLDHHPTNTMFGDIHLVMPRTVAAAEVIFHWLQQMEQAISTDVAVPLLTGLVTDTLGFRTNNVTAETLRIAVQLMEAGANLNDITARTLDSKSFRVLELWKHALPSVTLEAAVVAADVKQADLKAVKLDEVTDGGLVSLLNQVNEAYIAVVFKELPDGQIEISLRSKPGYDVSEVAFAVGGGGHKQASGATIAGPLDAARARILPMLQAVAQQV